MKHIKLFESIEEELPTTDYLNSLFINFIENENKFRVTHHIHKYDSNKITKVYFIIYIALKENKDVSYNGFDNISNHIENIKDTFLDIGNIVDIISSEYNKNITNMKYTPERFEFEVYCRCENEEKL